MARRYDGVSALGNMPRVCRLEPRATERQPPPMGVEASPSCSIATHLRGALSACRGIWAHAVRLALDIALPTLCVACREPVHGERLRGMLVQAVVHRAPYCLSPASIFDFATGSAISGQSIREYRPMCAPAPVELNSRQAQRSALRRKFISIFAAELLFGNRQGE